MPRRYSTSDAKSKFSEILRQVRDGSTVYVTYRGEEVAEIRPTATDRSTAASLRRLEREGILDPLLDPGLDPVLDSARRPAHEPATETAAGSEEGVAPKGRFRPVAVRPGALQRFLDSRD